MRKTLFISLVLAVGCYKASSDEVVIRSGSHSDFRLPTVMVNAGSIAYEVAFTETCRYDIGEDQTDINKLFGLGYMLAHRENSVRFGWWYDPSKDSVGIMAYWYDRGKRNADHLRYVALSDSHHYMIIARDDVHILTIDRLEVKRVVTKRSEICYALHPYFGGNRPAPHDIVIKMRRA